MSEHLKSSSLSDLLDLVGARAGTTLSVADILETFGNRAFGAMMFIFAAPLILPMPPGVSAILGAPLIFVTFQWMLGRRTLWLPKALLDRTMNVSDFRLVSEKMSPYLHRLERHMKPRLTFMYNPLGDRIVGALCFVLSLIVFLPIPLGNMLPSFAIAVFALGGAERDGVAAIVGWLAAILSFYILALLSKAFVAGIMAFLGTLLGMF